MSEQHQHDDDDAFAERIARPMRAPERANDGFEDSLIDAIKARKPLRPLIARRAQPWSPVWWANGDVRLSPVVGLALAAGIAALAVLVTRQSVRPSQPTVQPVAVATTRVRDTVTFVRFVFVGQAKSVTLVGDFNAWGGEPRTLNRTPSGAWTTSVPLSNGRHEYAFIVDGKHWVADPLVPSSSDEFDTSSSVITVGTD